MSKEKLTKVENAILSQLLGTFSPKHPSSITAAPVRSSKSNFTRLDKEFVTKAKNSKASVTIKNFCTTSEKLVVQKNTLA